MVERLNFLEEDQVSFFQTEIQRLIDEWATLTDELLSFTSSDFPLITTNQLGMWLLAAKEKQRTEVKDRLSALIQMLKDN